MIIAIAALIVVVAGVGYYATGKQPQTAGTTRAPASGETEERGSLGRISFKNPKKPPHYESNTPAHGAVLAGIPINVVIDFNFDVAKPSAITITSDGVEYGEGATVIDANRLTLRRAMRPDAPDGFYTVSYSACWPDQSCHDGSFQFAIDHSLQSGYKDLRGEKDVTVRLSQILFTPRDIIVNPGTKVTWVNDDEVEHYINTDSHPAHTYFPPQNSKLLAKGASFAQVFGEPGVYPYHCSAHVSMTASILVEAGEAVAMEDKYTGTVLAGKSAPLLDFTKADYDAALKSDKLIVLYFYANWCPICKAEFPIMQNAFNELSTNKAIGFRVNYNDDQTDNDEKNLAREFGVAYQHTKVFVKNGQRILKSPEGWDDKRYDTEINKALPK